MQPFSSVSGYLLLLPESAGIDTPSDDAPPDVIGFDGVVYGPLPLFNPVVSGGGFDSGFDSGFG